MGKRFDVEVHIRAIVTISSFLLYSKVRTIPSRFLLVMKWMDAHDFWDVCRPSVPSVHVFEPGLRGDLEAIGFQVNPYDPCVANRIVKNRQHTVIWHVDDLKSTRANK